MTSFIHEIALALADELRQRYPLDEIVLAPCSSYDLKGPNPESPTIHYSLSAIRDGKALFSITICGEELSITIHKDRPKMQVFDDIPNLDLAGFSISAGVILSKDCETKRFILAEPSCIEDVLSIIDEAYPQE